MSVSRTEVLSLLTQRELLIAQIGPGQSDEDSIRISRLIRLINARLPDSDILTEPVNIERLEKHFLHEGKRKLKYDGDNKCK